MANWAEVANITFTEVANASGVIRFGNTSTGPDVAWAYFPDSSFYAGDVWVNGSYSYNQTVTIGSFGMHTLVHEIGHALGLDHAGVYNGATAPPSPTHTYDTRQYSVMSYYNSANYAGLYAAEPSLHDIAAIQAIYGVNTTIRAGDSTYFWGANDKISPEAIWDAGGTDIIDASNQAGRVVLNLNAGTFSSIGLDNYSFAAVNNLTIAYGAVIERATGGSAGDLLTGNNVVNVLDGGGGADTLLGGDGDDTLIGGGGGDILTGGNGLDTLRYDNSASGVTANLATGSASGGDAANDVISGIENIVGSGAADVLTGDGAVNLLDGNGGADTLSGGDGNDTLIGGGGADTFVGGNGTDTVRFDGASAGVTVVMGGTSTGSDAAGDVFSSIENLVGSALADSLTGDGSANRLDGGDGNDTLTGGGGGDSLIGNSGTDMARYDSSAGAVTINLALGSASGGDAAGDSFSGIENLAGSAFADVLTGDGNANLLDGGGGGDTLIGGAGADSLVGNSGTDTVRYDSSASGVTVNLALGTGSGGDAAGDTLGGIENLIGSGLADVLTGDGSANVLDGGAGADTLTGGGGADTLIGGGGSDTVRYDNATVGVTVLLDGIGSVGDAAGDTFNGVENVVGSALADLLAGDGNVNTIDGGAGNDILIGGVGGDTLIGNGGIDTARYDNSSSGVTVNLALGTASGGDAAGDSFSGIENLGGSAYGDVLTGDGTANSISGGGDNLVTQSSGLSAAPWTRENLTVAVASVTGAPADVALWKATEGAQAATHHRFIRSIDNLTAGTTYTASFYAKAGERGKIVVESYFGTPGPATGLWGSFDLTTGAASMVNGAGSVGMEALGNGLYRCWFTGTMAAGGTSLLMVPRLALDGAHTGADGWGTVYSGDGSSGLYLGGFQVEAASSAGIYAATSSAVSGSGNDLLVGGAGADTLFGGGGIDTASYETSSAGVTVNLATGSGLGGDAQGDVVTGIEVLAGSAYADVLTGDSGDNTLVGGAGGDVLSGGGDNLISQSNNLVASQWSRDNVSVGTAVLSNEPAGVDFWKVTEGTQAATHHRMVRSIAGLTGGTSYTASFYAKAGERGKIVVESYFGTPGAATGLWGSFDLTTGTASVVNGTVGTVGMALVGDGIYRCWFTGTMATGGTSLIMVPRLALGGVHTGADGWGSVYSGDGASGLYMGGFQVESGAAPNAFVPTDASVKGSGSDVLTGGAGGDTLLGGGGTDTAGYQDSAIGVTIDLNKGIGLFGDAAGDVLSGIENLIGSAQNDTLTGDSHGNLLDGGAGDDVLSGGGDNLVSQSNTLSAVQWTRDNVSVATASLTGTPTGVSMSKATEGNQAATHHRVIRQVDGLTAGTSYTASFYAKAGERGKIVVESYFGTPGAATGLWGSFDLTTGTASLVNGTGAVGMELIGDGIYRCWFTKAMAAGGTSLVMVPRLALGGVHGGGDAWGTVYSGDGVSGLYMGGFQVEGATSPGSFVATDSAIRTSGADSLLGGAGNDTYLFAAGWGSDTVTDSEGANALNFGVMDISQLTAVTQGGDLVISSSGNTITIGQYVGHESAFSFGNATGSFDSAAWIDQSGLGSQGPASASILAGDPTLQSGLLAAS